MIVRRRNLRENGLGSDPIERRFVDVDFVHAQIVGIDSFQEHLSGFDEWRFLEISFTRHVFGNCEFLVQLVIAEVTQRLNRKKTGN